MNQIQFTVTITTTAPIVSIDEKEEMVGNILQGLKTTAITEGIAPVESPACTKKITVSCGTITKTVEIF
jgi:hypothetical protein